MYTVDYMYTVFPAFLSIVDLACNFWRVCDFFPFKDENHFGNFSYQKQIECHNASPENVVQLKTYAEWYFFQYFQGNFISCFIIACFMRFEPGNIFINDNRYLRNSSLDDELRYSLVWTWKIFNSSLTFACSNDIEL